jgi:hypothetical protein
MAANMKDFQEHANDIAEKYLMALGHTRSYLTNIDWDGDGTNIHINFEASYCSCCSPDQETEYMPISYLWDDDWQKNIPGILAERKADAERAKQQKKRDAEQARRTQDLAQLAKLKAKYEDEGNE